jgi:hypothetical protein
MKGEKQMDKNDKKHNDKADKKKPLPKNYPKVKGLENLGSTVSSGKKPKKTY